MGIDNVRGLLVDLTIYDEQMKTDLGTQVDRTIASVNESSPGQGSS